MQARLLISISNRPWLTLVVIAFVTGAALFVLTDFERSTIKLDIDPSIDGLLPTSGSELDVFRQTRDRFGGDDVLLVAWLADEIFTHDRLSALKRVTNSLQNLPGVVRVDSLASTSRIQVKNEFTDVDAFLRTVPQELDALADLRAAALSNQLFLGHLVSADGRGVLLGIHFDPELSAATLAGLVDEIAFLSATEAAAAGEVRQFISGPIYGRLSLSRALFRDLQQVLPFAVFGSLLVAAIAFRSVRGVILPLASTTIALVCSLALFTLGGHALNLVTVIIPPVIFHVGFAYTVHLVSNFDRELKLGLDRHAAITNSLREVILPLGLTALTTSIGFFSLAMSRIEAIRVFGVFAAIGTLMAYLCALVVVPAGLRLIPLGRPPRQERSWVDSFAEQLARFDLKHRRAILFSGAALALLSGLSATQLQISTDYLQNFPADNPVRSDFNHLNTTFGGLVPLQIVIESDITEAFKDPIQLQIIYDLQQWLMAQPEIGGVISIVDYIKLLHRALIGEVHDPEAIPSSIALIDQLLLIGGGDAERFADRHYKTTLLHVRSRAVATGELAGLIGRIETRLAELPGHLRGQVTGSSVLIARTIDDITAGQLQSLAGAAFVIYLILVILFGSLRVGALGLLPNLLPILVYFGLLGLTGITLNITTSMVAAVALGIAVDDTIHFLARFNAEARRFANAPLGVERAMQTIIRPVTCTSAALCVGFLALTMGEIRNQIEFGALAAAILFIAWVLDLTFTPALSGHLRFVTLWESLTVDLGCAKPHETIPLFHGLSERQARIAALMGAIESFQPGERIVHIGDPVNEIRVVIDGELSASVPRAIGDQVLRTLRRGDVIGEVGFFHGESTANVDTVSGVKVLRLKEACLQRIQLRYPRIGAQLLRNIGEIMADHLADETARLA